MDPNAAVKESAVVIKGGLYNTMVSIHKVNGRIFLTDWERLSHVVCQFTGPALLHKLLLFDLDLSEYGQ